MFDRIPRFSTCPQEFLRDYENFKKAIADLDRRLASIACQAFSDCSGLEAAFKLIDIFSSLLERPLIKNDFDPNYPLMVSFVVVRIVVAVVLVSRWTSDFRRFNLTGLFRMHIKNFSCPQCLSQHASSAVRCQKCACPWDLRTGNEKFDRLVQVTMMDDILNEVKQIYDQHMALKAETGTMPIHRNMATVSGSLKFTQELRDRITVPMQRFKMCEHP